MKGAEGSVCLYRLWLLVYPAPTTKLCYSQAVGPSLGRAAALSFLRPPSMSPAAEQCPCRATRSEDLLNDRLTILLENESRIIKGPRKPLISLEKHIILLYEMSEHNK